MIGWRILALGAMAFLAACGTQPTDRMISGGGIGAAGGAILGAVTGLTVVQGALLGTGLGAAFGGLTDPNKINLGEPIWRRFDTTPAGHASGAAPQTSNMVAATQANLTRLGYRPGPIDGRMGSKTRAAIRRYQKDNGLPATGEMNAQVAMEIEKAAGGVAN